MKDKFDEIAAKWGKEAALERARTYLSSLILGRDFLEPVESFSARCPTYREVKAWVEANK